MLKALPLRVVLPLFVLLANTDIAVFHSPSCLAAETASATLTAPDSIYKEIEELIKQSYPKAKFVREGNNINCSYKTKTEYGYYSRRQIEVPGPGGLWLEIQLKPGEYTEPDKDLLPSEKNEGYHTILTMAPYSKAMQAHLMVQMRYPSETSLEFKDRIKEIAGSFTDYRPKKKKSASATTSEEKPKGEEEKPKVAERAKEPETPPEETKPEKKEVEAPPESSTISTSPEKSDAAPIIESSEKTDISGGISKTETPTTTEAPALTERQQKMAVLRRMLSTFLPDWENMLPGILVNFEKNDKIKTVKANKKLTAAVKQQKIKALETSSVKKVVRIKQLLAEHKIDIALECLNLAVAGIDSITDWTLEDYRDIEGFSRLLAKTKAKYEKEVPGLFKTGKLNDAAMETLKSKFTAKCKPLADQLTAKLGPVVSQLNKEEAAGKFR